MKDIRWHFFTFISNNTSQPHIKLCLTFTVSSFLWLLLALRLFFCCCSMIFFRLLIGPLGWRHFAVCTSADATKTLSKVPTWLWVHFAGFCSKTIMQLCLFYLFHVSVCWRENSCEVASGFPSFCGLLWLSKGSLKRLIGSLMPSKQLEVSWLFQGL